MTSDSTAHITLEEDEEYWERWSLNLFEPRLVKPMKKPLTAPLDLAISESDMKKLKAGFRPRSQDDKWAWLIKDEDGNMSVHIIRHFVHEEVYILHIALKSSDDDGGSARIHSITWEGDMNGTQHDVEQAKRTITILARVILKCDFEKLPQYTSG